MTSAIGAYRLELPPGATVDLDDAERRSLRAQLRPDPSARHAHQGRLDPARRLLVEAALHYRLKPALSGKPAGGRALPAGGARGHTHDAPRRCGRYRRRSLRRARYR